GITDISCGADRIFQGTGLLEGIAIGNGAILGPPSPGTPAAAGNLQLQGDVQGRPVHAGLSAGDDALEHGRKVEKTRIKSDKMQRQVDRETRTLSPCLPVSLSPCLLLSLSLLVSWADDDEAAVGAGDGSADQEQVILAIDAHQREVADSALGVAVL